MTSPNIQMLETAYLDAAAELRSAQAGFLNMDQEIHAFVTVRDALKEHPEFCGHLPETYFSGGDLDPEGSPK